MASLIKPGSVKVVTQDGEVQLSITLELNINLNSNGLAATVTTVKTEENKKKEESTEWAIPDFDFSPKIDFGKRE